MIVKLTKLTKMADGSLNAYVTHPQALTGASLKFPSDKLDWLNKQHSEDQTLKIEECEGWSEKIKQKAESDTEGVDSRE